MALRKSVNGEVAGFSGQGAGAGFAGLQAPPPGRETLGPTQQYYEVCRASANKATSYWSARHHILSKDGRVKQ